MKVCVVLVVCTDGGCEGATAKESGNGKGRRAEGREERKCPRRFQATITSLMNSFGSA